MITEISSKRQWERTLAAIKKFDTYHTFDFHSAHLKPFEQAVLVKYQSENTIIAMPLIIRPIEDSPYFDATSVYGYSGPITMGRLDPEIIADFQLQLAQYFTAKELISVFSRLNPFIDHQSYLLDGMGEIIKLGNVVTIDLNTDPIIQRQQYSRTTKRYLNKCRRVCNIQFTKNFADIQTFIKLYHDNMKRVQADCTYYFDKEYGEKIISAEEFDGELVQVSLKATGEIICMAIMLKCNDIIQYHLSGTKEEFRFLSPMRLVIDETRERGNREGYRYFNLGGGFGSQNDSLLQFKSSFSKNYRRFSIWKYIVNESAYNTLIANLGDDHSDTNFFPLYRSNLFKV